MNKLAKYAKIGDLESVKSLIENGADIHADVEYALRLSVQNGHLEVAKYLIDKGADIHACNDEALRLSVQNGHLEVAKYLIDKGANYKYVFHRLDKDFQIWIVRYILSIKRIQSWILAIFSKPYYKDGNMGFLARQGLEEINRMSKN